MPSCNRPPVRSAECLVEDLDEKGQGRPPNAGPMSLNSQDKGQLMIRIRHKDPRGVVVKDHNGIILRAGTCPKITIGWLGHPSVGRVRCRLAIRLLIRACKDVVAEVARQG